MQPFKVIEVRHLICIVVFCFVVNVLSELQHISNLSALKVYLLYFLSSGKAVDIPKINSKIPTHFSPTPWVRKNKGVHICENSVAFAQNSSKRCVALSFKLFECMCVCLCVCWHSLYLFLSHYICTAKELLNVCTDKR